MHTLVTFARLGLASLILALPAAAGTTYHVDAGALPGGDGLGWATAYADLDKALRVAIDGDQVWVKAGTYKPTELSIWWDPRTAFFRPALGISLYGGFDGTEATLAERAGLFDQTILSGDLGTIGDNSDNAYHVIQVSASGPPPMTLIDGFTIEEGNANAFNIDNYGGGVYSSNALTKLVNCTVQNNRALIGGGLAAPVAGRVEILDCRFLNNSATSNGGGMWGGTITFKVYNTEYRGNTAGNKGGAIAVTWTSPTANQYQNVVFHGNSGNVGGAVWMAGGSSNGNLSGKPGGGLFTNCTFAFNFASQAGGALYAATSAGASAKSKIKNSILWGNVAPAGRQLLGPHTVVFTDVMGGWPGKGNKNVDPRFYNVDDVRIRPSSAVRNRAHYNKVLDDYFDIDGDGNKTEPTPYDLLGNPRAVTPQRVDMGAYEVQ